MQEVALKSYLSRQGDLSQHHGVFSDTRSRSDLLELLCFVAKVVPGALFAKTVLAPILTTAKCLHIGEFRFTHATRDHSRAASVNLAARDQLR